MKKILFWLAVFGMSMLVMVQPARAVEQVLPTSGGIKYFYYQQPSYLGHTPIEGCLAFYNRNAVTYTATVADNGIYNGGSAGGAHQWICTLRNISTGNYSDGSYINPLMTAAVCPVAVPAYTYNAATNMCERADAPACPAADTTAGAYWITTGTTPDSIYTFGLGNYCKTGCQTKSFLTAPRPAGYPPSDGASKVVGGVKTYFSFREYAYTGATCTGGDSLPVASTVPPADSCAAGQSIIQMGTKIRCINPATGQAVDTNSASAVAAAKTLADAKLAGQLEAAASAVAAAGGSAADIAAAKSVAAGVAAAGGTAAGGIANPDPVMGAFCAENPQASICKEQTDGNKAVGTAALDGLYTEGDLIAGKTVSGVIGAFKTRVLSSGIGSAIGGFFTVNQAAGTCPVWSANIPVMGMLTFDFYCQSTFQNLLPWIRSVLLLIFSVIAFRIAVL